MKMYFSFTWNQDKALAHSYQEMCLVPLWGDCVSGSTMGGLCARFHQYARGILPKKHVKVMKGETILYVVQMIYAFHSGKYVNSIESISMKKKLNNNVRLY